MSELHQHRDAVGVQRVENLAVGVGLLAGAIAVGGPWWIVFAAFLAFDLSALGYLAGPRWGARSYNAVHNYTVPAVLAAVFVVLHVDGEAPSWLGWLAVSWAFHVAVDRALGYGPKLASFTETHLGRIGR